MKALIVSSKWCLVIRPREENATGPGERAGRALVRLWEGVGRRTSVNVSFGRKTDLAFLLELALLCGVSPDLDPRPRLIAPA